MEKTEFKAQQKLRSFAHLTGKAFMVAGRKIVVEGLHLFEIMVRDDTYYKVIVRYRPEEGDQKTYMKYEPLDRFLVQAH